jgi:hypothetical protein
MSLSYIRIAKTPDVERVLSDLRAKFSLLNEAEIIKLALSEVHNRGTDTISAILYAKHYYRLFNLIKC